MLKSLIASVVARCTHRPWLIILGWVVVAVAAGVYNGRLTLANLSPVLDKGSETIETVLAGKPASFSFQELLPAAPDQPSARLRFVEIHPMLDYSSIEPGKEASDAVRKAAVDLGLPQKYQARVRLTGAV